MNDSLLGHRALTDSRPSADVTLITLRVADLAAALLDRLNAQPVVHCTTNTPRELLAADGVKIELLRRLLDRMGQPQEPSQETILKSVWQDPFQHGSDACVLADEIAHAWA